MRPAPEEPVFTGRAAVLLALVWLPLGLVIYFVFGLLGVILNPWGTPLEELPELYADVLLLPSLPLCWGWVLGVIAYLRKRPFPKRAVLIILGATLLYCVLLIAGVLIYALR